MRVRVCVCACVRVCVRACSCTCVCAYACARGVLVFVRARVKGHTRERERVAEGGAVVVVGEVTQAVVGVRMVEVAADHKVSLLATVCLRIWRA